MKVLHLNRFFYSGQTTHVFSLIKEQQKQGMRSDLVIEGYPSVKALDSYKETMKGLQATIIRPGDEAIITRQIKQMRYDIIHAHSSLTFGLAHKLSLQFQIPFVITCHGLGLNKEDFRPFLQNAAALFCPGKRVADSMHEYADKVRLIKNGVDLNDFKPALKTDPVKIVLLARIDHYKQDGYVQLCKAVDLLDNVIFFVASDKPPHSFTAKYLGWVEKVADLLRETDIVVGTGRAVVEGLAAGNAVIVLGRAYQGILTPEKAESQKNWDQSGLFGSEPCYKDIFFDIVKLTQNRTYLKQLQEYGRKLAEERFDIRIVCEYMAEVYRECFAGRQ